MNDRLSTAQHVGFWVWLLGGGLCASAVFLLLAGENREIGLHALGAIFAMSVLAYALLARRAPYGVAVVALWGLGLGVWFPAWINAIGPVTHHWLVELGLADPNLAARLPVPMAIATAGATTGAVMYLMTRSWRVVIQTALLSLVVAATPLVPVHEDWAVMFGVIAWHVAVSGSLFRWAMDCVRSGAGLTCSACGFDLAGLSSPVCPSCGQSLSRRQAVVQHSRPAPRSAAPKPAGRWY
jgi:hypothetical protein